MKTFDFKPLIGHGRNVSTPPVISTPQSVHRLSAESRYGAPAIALFIFLLSTLDPHPSAAQAPPTNVVVPITRAVMTDSNGVLKTPTNFFDANAALVARGAGAGILSATNVWSGTNNFTNALQFKGTNVLTTNGNGSGLSGFTAGQIPSLDAGKITTGVFPVANGGTGAANNASAENQVGVFQLSSDAPVGTTNAATSAGQLGISGDRFLFVSTGTSAGAWNGNFSFLSEFGGIGHPYLAGSGSPVFVNEYMSGDPSLQTSSHSSDDPIHRFLSPNPYGSGGGIGFAIATKNSSGNGTAVSTNSSSEAIYWRGGDVNGYSEQAVPEQNATNNNPGWFQIIGDGPAFPIAISENTSVASHQGLYVFVYFTNGISVFPQWIGTNNFPIAGTGENPTLKIDQVNNVVTLGTNTLFKTANGTLQWNLSNGHINFAAFDSTQAGTIPLNSATLDITKIIPNSFTSAAQPLLDAGNNGTGIYFAADGNLSESVSGTKVAAFTPGGLVMANTNGVGTLATNFAVLTTTGWTNPWTVNAVAYVLGSAIGYTNFDGAGNAYMTNTTLANTFQTLILQPGAKLKSASGLSGTAHAL